MMSLAALSSPAQAVTYYESRDNYYTDRESCGSEWFGKGAERLGLSGPVDPGQFRALLDGRLPDGTQLGTQRHGEIQHIPGWDLTFSAPKSVSIVGLVGGDERVIAAHRQAAEEALRKVEAGHLYTRSRDDGTVRPVQSTSAVVARFHHDTNRNQDPHLHTHSVLLNATERHGQWRSVHSWPIFVAQKDIGVFYRACLAERLVALGYRLEHGRDATFEIQGVPKELVQQWSSRANEVDAALTNRGTDRDHASEREKEVATKNTRSPKQDVDRYGLQDAWRSTAGERLDHVQATINQSRVDRPERAQSGDRSHAADAGARRAVDYAVSTLSEREAAFTRDRLSGEAIADGIGKTTMAAIGAEIERRIERRDLIEKSIRIMDPVQRSDRTVMGLTTAVNVATEERMIDMARAGRDMVRAIASESEARAIQDAATGISAEKGYTWTQDQRMAVQGLLRSRDELLLVQGLAGSAKTSTVLATLVMAAQDKGIRVEGYAPTASAAKVMSRDLGIDAQTVSRHLADRSVGAAKPIAGTLRLVDEASMISTRDMTSLLAGARADGARLVLVGDRYQHGSVGGGQAFGQLQDAGTRTFVLGDIVRQSDPDLRQAVYDALRPAAKDALERIRQSGTVIEEQNVDSRRESIVRAFLDREPAERLRTLIIDPSRESRDLVAQGVRAGLRAEQTIGAAEIRAPALDTAMSTTAERSRARTYEPGDVIRFRRSYSMVGGTARQGDYYRVTATDLEHNRVHLTNRETGPLEWNPAQKGSGYVEHYQRVDRPLSVGDSIVWTRNDRDLDLTNGTRAEVAHIDATARTVDLRLQDGRSCQIRIDDPSHQHYRYGYVHTSMAAQGATANHVIAHAESYRINLVNQKSFYVAISRAKDGVTLVTDEEGKLVTAIHERAGEKPTALGKLDINEPERSFLETLKEAIGRVFRGQELGRDPAPSPELVRSDMGHNREDRVR